MLKRINSNKENQRIQRSLSTNSYIPTSPFSKERRKKSPANVLKTCENTLSTVSSKSKIQSTMRLSVLEKENYSLKSLLSSVEENFKATMAGKEKEILKLNKIVLDLVKKNEQTQQKLKQYTSQNSSISSSNTSLIIRQLNLLDTKLKEAEKLSSPQFLPPTIAPDIIIHKSNMMTGNMPIPSTMKVLSIAEIAKLNRNN